MSMDLRKSLRGKPDSTEEHHFRAAEFGRLQRGEEQQPMSLAVPEKETFANRTVLPRVSRPDDQLVYLQIRAFGRDFTPDRNTETCGRGARAQHAV